MTELQTDEYSGNRDFNSMNIEEKILVMSSRFRVPGGKPPEEALADLKKRISEKEADIVMMQATNKRLILRVSSVAATILLLFGVWQLFSVFSETQVVSGKGSHTAYILPDGSEVNLNAESRITFRKKNFGSERRVALEGEAFFNVTKGSSFRIVTTNGEIMILGTSFNVFSRANTFKVSCLTGRVLVTSNNQSVTIEPGESAELSGVNLKSFRDERFQYATGWLNGEFYFENTPLNMVFDEIERQFNVKFEAWGNENRFFTGSFTNKDLKEALETVCIVMKLEYEIGENEKISISNKK